MTAIDNDNQKKIKVDVLHIKRGLLTSRIVSETPLQGDIIIIENEHYLIKYRQWNYTDSKRKTLKQDVLNIKLIVEELSN